MASTMVTIVSGLIVSYHIGSHSEGAAFGVWCTRRWIGLSDLALEIASIMEGSSCFYIFHLKYILLYLQIRRKALLIAPSPSLITQFQTPFPARRPSQIG